MVCLLMGCAFGVINFGLLFLGGRASCLASGQFELHEQLLSVREELYYFSYILICSKCTFRYTYHVTTCLPSMLIIF